MTGQRQGTTHVNVSDSHAIAPEDLLRLSRMGREIRVLDQILSRDVDTVSIVESGPAAAWTTLDGDHISFALNHLPIPRSAVEVAIWLGTNAHELGHVLHTPRRDSLLMRRVIEGNKVTLPGIFKLWNIAEDQRQERRVLARFGPWAPYLIAALGHHLRADHESAWILMCGRTWLSPAMRAEARAHFVAARNASVADKVADLIGTYQRLDDPGESEADEAWAVLNELYDLFAENMPTLPEPCQPVDGGDADTDPVNGDPYPTADDDPDPDPDADADDGDKGDDDERGDGSGSGPEDDDGDDAADADGAGDGDGDSGNTSENPNPDATTTSKDPAPFDKDDLKRQLADEARRQMDEDRGDIDNVLDALDHGRPGDEVDADRAEGRDIDATDAARRLWHEVGDALLDLKDESEPGWNRHVDSGKLRPTRVLDTIERGVGTPEAWFDRYEPGHLDATEMEAVVLVDVSTSMRDFTHTLGEATWAIRRAVDDLEGRLTVLTYDSGPFRVIAAAGERPDNRMFVPRASGGTDPLSALREAYHILANSEAPIRIMVILTDGDWYGLVNESEATIAAMAQVGVTTVLAFLPNPGFGVAAMDAHGCEVAESIEDVHGLARLFAKIADIRIRNRW